MKLILPLPPSVNGYFLHVVRRRADGSSYVDTALGSDGKAYVKAVKNLVATQLVAHKPLAGRLSVRVVLSGETDAEFDLDNRMKGLLDAITKAGVWADDSQIDRLVIERGPVIRTKKHKDKLTGKFVVDFKGGRCEVRIAVIATSERQKTLFVGES